MYKEVKKIGKGSFGVVYEINWVKDNKKFVWKRLDYGPMSDKEKQQLVSEVNILRLMKNPNIVQYVDRIIDKDNQRIYIVMELCEGGDL